VALRRLREIVMGALMTRCPKQAAEVVAAAARCAKVVQSSAVAA
jgi:hypothetical protein